MDMMDSTNIKPKSLNLKREMKKCSFLFRMNIIQMSLFNFMNPVSFQSVDSNGTKLCQTSFHMKKVAGDF